MFKTSVKVLMLAVVLGLGYGFVADSPKVAAAAQYVSPSAACAGGVPSTWGNHGVGHNQGAMAAVQIRAVDTKGNLINTSYTLNSGDPYGNPNAQIWDYSQLGKGNAGRQKKVFRTGENVYGAAGAYNCNGYSQLAAGAKINGEWRVGNGWVVDCTDGGKPNKFWITNVDTPNGESGTWWLYQYDASLGTWGTAVDKDVNGPTLEKNKVKFDVINGGDVYLKLEWHPEPPQSDPSSKTVDCTLLEFTNRSNFRRKQYPTESPLKTRWVVTVSGAKVTKTTWGDAPAGTNGGSNQDIYLLNPGYAPAENETSISATSQKTKRYQMMPLRSNMTVTAVEQYYWPSGSAKGWHDITSANSNDPKSFSTTKNCYKPSCSISVDDIAGTGPEDRVLVNDNVDVTVRIHNGPMSNPADKINLWYPYVDYSDNNGQSGRSFYTRSLAANGDSSTTKISLRAPASIKNWQINFKVGSHAATDLYQDNITCSVTTPVYKPFGVSLDAGVTTDSDEDPTKITYFTKIRNDDGSAVTVNTTSDYYKKPGGSGKQALITPSPKGPENISATANADTYTIHGVNQPIPSFAAGDQFCARITSTFTSGYVGPGGSVIGANGPGDTGERCATIYNKPYFKIFGSGAKAGGDFAEVTSACKTGGGTLAGWNNNTGAIDRGASSELSSLALIKITGFASAQTVPSGRSPADLTFANGGAGVSITSPITPDAYSPSLGGNFSSAECLPTVSEPESGVQTFNGAFLVLINGGAASKKYTNPSNGFVVMGGPSTDPSTPVGTVIPNGSDRSIFVDGDVYINSNITYNTTGWGTKDDIPSFVLKATGNIYIGAGVTQLDGLYIARPKADGTKGKIFTCSSLYGVPFAWFDNFSSPPKATEIPFGMHNFCRNQLKVNGAFVAEQVNLMRTYGSLRDTRTFPYESRGSINHTCSNAGSTSTCAAEVFDFNPEFYLANPAVKKNSETAPKWDSLISLPPVL